MRNLSGLTTFAKVCLTPFFLLFFRGSGKSYSMMGYGADRGIIPLTCSALFDRIKEKTTDLLSYTVEVSFIEIYNEKVPSPSVQALPYVDRLS